jgi:hypothetical protein
MDAATMNKDLGGLQFRVQKILSLHWTWRYSPPSQQVQQHARMHQLL